MGSGFESQGAHFKENPADSSESAGFLRSLNKCSFVVRGAYYPLCSCRGPVLAELGHPDVAAEDICTSAHLWFRGSRNPAGSLGCVVAQYVRPVPSELWRGRAVAFWCVAWWLGVLPVGARTCAVPQASNVADSRHTKARHRHTTAAGNHFKKS